VPPKLTDASSLSSPPLEKVTGLTPVAPALATSIVPPLIVVPTASPPDATNS